MEAHSVLAAPHNCAEMLGSSTAMDRAEPSTMGSMLLYSYPVRVAETHNCSPTLDNMPGDLRITWHINETRLDQRRCLKIPRNLVSRSAGFSKWYNLSLHLYWLLCFLSFNTSSNRRRASLSQVCVLQLVLWIRPMTDTSYYPAISQHQGGTAPLPTRRKTTSWCCRGTWCKYCIYQECESVLCWLHGFFPSFHSINSIPPPISWFGLTSVYSDVNSTQSR